MHPQAATLWKGPQWALALLLAALTMVGPFSIDTYIPAFSGIASALHATPVQMQQTLSAYLFGFAFMSLFHGALSDSFGRRPVVLCGMAAFGLASAGCALSGHVEQLVLFRALQGISAGAGIVVSRAVVRDMFAPARAQKVMSQITIYFGIAPTIAPIIGGGLLVLMGWQSVFWFLALVGALLWLASWRLLPETLHTSFRQPFQVRHLMHGYRQLCASPRFLLLVLASGVPFNGMFLYVMSAPAWLGGHLGLAPTQFFWLFLLIIGGIMSGAWISGWLAGKVAPAAQIGLGFSIMAAVAVLNLLANVFFEPRAWWALPPIGLFSLGWALVSPATTLLVLDLFPLRRGMASSLQASATSVANGLVAGLLAPLVMDTPAGLAAGSLGLMGVGLVAWVLLRLRWPDVGRELQRH
ncbi:Bcr/CflA family efflux MFS transporter [Xylophilus rhododendri]|uniref:Bcr/CflA family efflux transporter n=1 Tax=Xylophilus rhododendri TaxID=2697032 RepID=A0A857J8B9_9BURK|nr:multidrug effflux MFS transporter [Xylophilus rhododendri]QHJ00301.1 Bcr/CflA family efflux MFS transporter [Xylophilus rhododendri]